VWGFWQMILLVFFLHWIMSLTSICFSEEMCIQMSKGKRIQSSSMVCLNSVSWICFVGFLDKVVFSCGWFTFVLNLPVHLKCLWSEIFYYLIWRSFQNDEEWRLFYCDGALGCRVVQDFDLWKLDDLWRHFGDKKWRKIT